ncbi:SDR family NAD(P)-dependent oxidoreductase [Streptomyces collinus]|uniref:SDR family NAD(P)-dependent oxidoreductase n=1 Tax=Streptomyces collinus TaxID=42684 RepID=UPI0036C2FC29
MGLATAKILGSDHRVVITDVNRQRLDAAAAELRDHGVDAAAVACDITSRASVEALFQQPTAKAPCGRSCTPRASARRWAPRTRSSGSTRSAPSTSRKPPSRSPPRDSHWSTSPPSPGT